MARLKPFHLRKLVGHIKHQKGEIKYHILTIIKNAFSYSFGAAFTPILGFIFIPIYTRLLSVDNFGVLAIVQTSQLLVVAVLALGLSNALSRIYYDNQDTQEKAKYIASIFWFLIILASGFLLLSFIFHHKINKLLFNNEQSQVLIYLLILSIMPELITSTCMSFLQIKIKPVIYSVSQIIKSLLYHSIAVYLVMAGYAINGFLTAGIIAAMISSAFIIFYIKDDISLSKYDFKFIKLLIKSGIPLMLIAVIAWIIELSDRYLLNRYINSFEVGLYSLSCKAVMVLSFTNTMFLSAVPIYLFKVRESNKELGEHLQTEVLRYYMLIALLLTLTLSLFSKEIIYILAPASYQSAYKYVAILAFSCVFSGGFFILHVGIANSKKFQYLLICFATSGLLNILLNLLLIPKYAGLGAAIATVISYLVLMLLGNYFSQRLYYMKWNYKTPALLFVIVILLCILGNIILFENIFFNMMYKTGILVFYCIVMLLLGINQDEKIFIRQILKFNE